MMSGIRAELDRERSPGPWIAAARTLAAQGRISADGVLYFVEIFLECITAHAAAHDAEMLRIYAEIDRVKRAHGLRDDEDWLVHEGPPEWRALNAAWDRRDDEIRIATLRGLGHHDIADIMARDPEDFRLRASAGLVDVWGEEGAAG